MTNLIFAGVLMLAVLAFGIHVVVGIIKDHTR